MNCSPLPVPLVPNVPERSPELISEVERAANMLKEVFDAWEVSSTVLHWASFNNVDTYSRGSTKRRSRRTFLTSRGSSSSSKIRRPRISLVSMVTIMLQTAHLNGLAGYELPTEFAWKTNLLDKHPNFDRVLHFLRRLFWIDTVASIKDDKEREDWLEQLKSMQMSASRRSCRRSPPTRRRRRARS